MGRFLSNLIKLYRRFSNKKYGWHGNYPSWEKALENCTGYNAENILLKVKESILKVKSGAAVYERDSVLFDKIQYSWPLLSNLLWIAIQNEGKLGVIDFGGSLGSSYFQNNRYLNSLKVFKWSIVEQNDFVITGQREIEEGNLKFFFSIDEANLHRGNHDVLLLSCVLPYLEKPYDFLKEIKSKGFKYIIVDNTYFNPEHGDRLTVQNVPPTFYEASYPAWFLDYEKIVTILEEKYKIVEEYSNDQVIFFMGGKITYRGFILKLNSTRESDDYNI